MTYSTTYHQTTEAQRHRNNRRSKEQDRNLQTPSQKDKESNLDRPSPIHQKASLDQRHPFLQVRDPHHSLITNIKKRLNLQPLILQPKPQSLDLQTSSTHPSRQKKHSDETSERHATKTLHSPIFSLKSLPSDASPKDFRTKMSEFLLSPKTEK